MSEISSCKESKDSKYKVLAFKEKIFDILCTEMMVKKEFARLEFVMNGVLSHEGHQ